MFRACGECLANENIVNGKIPFAHKLGADGMNTHKSAGAMRRRAKIHEKEQITRWVSTSDDPDTAVENIFGSWPPSLS